MLKSPVFATSVVTIYLLLYTLLFQLGASKNITAVMFFFSPFLVIWMAITIMKYGKYSGADLNDNEEWGYQDVDKKEL